MFYLFDDTGATSTFCADKDRLFDMFKVEKKTTVKDEETGEDKEEISYDLPDGYSIHEYDGDAPYLGALYLDGDEVKTRAFEVDEAAEKEKQKAAALEALDAKYKADKAELGSQYLDAAMLNDTDALNNIKAELEALNAKYDSDYTAFTAESTDTATSTDATSTADTAAASTSETASDTSTNTAATDTADASKGA